MRWRMIAVVLAVAVLMPAAPAAARHWHHPYRGFYPPFSWSVGIGLGWGWGPGWGWWGPPIMYEPVPVPAARTNLTAVDTDVEPEHARVFLNGELIGTADDFDGYPDYLYLEPGHYTVEFRLQGYRSQKVDIDAVPGRYVPIKFELERVKGEKAAPWYDRPEGLPVGRVFGPQGAASQNPTKPGPDVTLRPELGQPGPPARASRSVAAAALDLQITPPNAAIYVDNVMVGTGQELARLERGLAVTPGRHRIEVLAPGYESKTITVEVQEGEHQQVVVELEQGAGQTP
jgi:hypothetical protein